MVQAATMQALPAQRTLSTGDTSARGAHLFCSCGMVRQLFSHAALSKLADTLNEIRQTL